MIRFMIFLDNRWTGWNNKEDHCSGKQNRVRDEHSTCHNFSSFSFTNAESPPVTSDSSSCLLLQFSHYIRFKSLNFPGLKHWSSWCFNLYMILLLQGRDVCMLNTEQLLPDGCITLSFKLIKCYCTISSFIWYVLKNLKPSAISKQFHTLTASAIFVIPSVVLSSICHWNNFYLVPTQKTYWIYIKFI